MEDATIGGSRDDGDNLDGTLDVAGKCEQESHWHHLLPSAGHGTSCFCVHVLQESKIFSPANLRACQEDQGYNSLVSYWQENKYTLRYTGGLVPDVYQCFTKEMGVFANPTSKASPAKLRVAFEVAPFSLLVEKAGGKTSDATTGGSCLDIQINGVDQRTAGCFGSAAEVDRFNKMVLGK